MQSLETLAAASFEKSLPHSSKPALCRALLNELPALDREALLAELLSATDARAPRLIILSGVKDRLPSTFEFLTSRTYFDTGFSRVHSFTAFNVVFSSNRQPHELSDHLYPRDREVVRYFENRVRELYVGDKTRFFVGLVRLGPPDTDFNNRIASKFSMRAQGSLLRLLDEIMSEDNNM